MIPRIIHQSYKSVEHPYPRHWQQSWMENHPNWDYRFHTDADNRQLVSAHYPQFLDTFDAFPQGIMRADFARFLYLHLWGGVYVDLDYVCLKPIDRLFDEIPQIGIPELPENGCYHYHNALLISEMRNPFWLKCAEQAIHYFRWSKHLEVVWLAGPCRLQAAIESEQLNFLALSTRYVTPLDWFSYNTRLGKGDKEIETLRNKLRSGSIEVIRSAFPEAYALTFWDRRW
jgi:mannosyltransferase OCH1-like enzyme